MAQPEREILSVLGRNYGTHSVVNAIETECQGSYPRMVPVLSSQVTTDFLKYAVLAM